MFNESDIENYDNNTSTIQQLTKNYTKKQIKLEDLKINQVVIVNFYPHSQKYIYDLTPKFGKIIEVPENGNIFGYKIINYNTNSSEEIELLFHECMSYYGDSLGYEYDIFELVYKL
jgi:hypothetical protein